MRPQQQGRRNRNRGGGRRNQNPLQRSYESNGPDVKIRGNAQVIADKYATLARDALSSGDTVMAENYLQHAEHYNRIILAAQPQPREGEDEPAQNGRGNERDGNEARSRNEGQNNANGQDDRKQAGDSAHADDQQPESGRNEAPRNGEQPVIEGTPAEVRVEQAENSQVLEKPKRTRQRRPRKSAEPEAEQDAQPAASSDDDQEAPVAAE